MSDDDEKITRTKKPLSAAKLAAIEKMKEGRKRSLEAKRKAKEEEKQKKKEMKKAIKMRVEEEMNAPSLPLDDKDFMEDLKKKALEKTESPVIINEDELECNKVGVPDQSVTTAKPQKKVSLGFGGTSLGTEDVKPKKKKEVEFAKEEDTFLLHRDDDEELEVEIKQPKRRSAKKKKVVINNYYDEDEEEDDDEEVNNFYQRRSAKSRAPRAKPLSPEEEEIIQQYEAPIYYRSPTAMAGIRFV